MGIDPIVGDWKLKAVKSSKTLPPKLVEMFKDNPPKEQFQTYKEIEEGLLELTTNMILMDGSSRSSKWVCPKRGGNVKRLLPETLPENRSYVYTKLNPGEWVLTAMEDNVQFHVMHKVVSKDGKTINVTRFDTDLQGNVISFKEVWEKQ